jgi:phosphoribosylanthranilate isomerase
VLWPRSPRGITAERVARISEELPSHVMRVGVFVNESVENIRAIAERAHLTGDSVHGTSRRRYAEALDWPVLAPVVGDGPMLSHEAWAPEIPLLVDNIDPVRRRRYGAR